MLIAWIEMLVIVVLAVLMRPAVAKLNGVGLFVPASETLFRKALTIVSPGRSGPAQLISASREPRYRPPDR